MKYKLKKLPKKIKAIQFLYTTERIKQIQDFFGPNFFVCAYKDRHPNSLGKLTFKSALMSDVAGVCEGSYIIQDKTGNISVMTAEEFLKLYEPSKIQSDI